MPTASASTRKAFSTHQLASHPPPRYTLAATWNTACDAGGYTE